MNRFTNLAVAGAIVISGAMGGVIGAAMVGASAASNASPAATTVPAAGTAAPSTGAFHSNEDPGHEAGESAAREAAENNGTATFGPGGGVPPAQ